MRLALLAVAGLSLLAAIAFGAFRWAHGQAVAATDTAATQLARDNAGLLASELQKFRLLPLVLAEHPDVRAVLETRADDAVARVNARLELLAGRTDAAALYVIARDGRTLAASNHRLPTSFVGQNYGFRPYFADALRRGDAELFALGTVSGRPGLYLARRIGTAATPLGVIVVKIEFEPLQRAWARQQGTTLVTDQHGVVIITSRPEWRFGTLGPLGPDARTAIRATRQYGNLPLSPLPLTVDGPGTGPPEARVATAALPLKDARLNAMVPLAPALASAYANARLITLGALVVIAGLLLLVWRARERQLLQLAARRALEEEVAARTAELRDTSRRYREAREELAQASRLGSLGQITAGVAHEINQPVAAIRSFADNARAFLAGGKTDRTDQNLGRIVELTQRIGTITAELRDFARRRTPSIGPLDLDSALDSALLLIGDTVRGQGVALDRDGTPGLMVVADRVRLEQILINLIQNALEAMAGRKGGAIHIIRQLRGDRVRIDVVDNGPGISAELADQLFMPFVTGREQGLGLGLAIARNIARDFGGELEQVASPLGGAGFRITLRAAS